MTLLDNLSDRAVAHHHDVQTALQTILAHTIEVVDGLHGFVALIVDSLNAINESLPFIVVLFLQFQ